jgi:hypothetical protein
MRIMEVGWEQERPVQDEGNRGGVGEREASQYRMRVMEVGWEQERLIQDEGNRGGVGTREARNRMRVMEVG